MSMTITGPVQNQELVAMLNAANRPDLIREGFELDGDLFEACRAEQDRLHGSASAEWKDAHAAYSAYFQTRKTAPAIELDKPATDEERETRVFRALNAFLSDSSVTREAVTGGLKAVSSTIEETSRKFRDSFLIMSSTAADTSKKQTERQTEQIVTSLTTNTDATIATADVVAASVRLAADQISESERQTAIAVRSVREVQSEAGQHLIFIGRTLSELITQQAKSSTAARSLLLDAKNEAERRAEAAGKQTAAFAEKITSGLAAIFESSRRNEMAGYARLIVLVGIFLLLALQGRGQTPVAGIGTAGTPKGGVASVQGVSGGTPLPVSGTVTATPTGTQDTNTKQLNGTTVDTNSGSKSAGTQRVVIATDQPAMTNAQPANISQVQGATPDPCFGTARSFFSISQAASARVITGTSSKKIYICSINVVGADAENITVVEGTGSTCGTNTIAVPGFPAATAANGWNFGANGGLSANGGGGSMAATSVNADDVCVFQSGTGRVAGGGSYVVQ